MSFVFPEIDPVAFSFGQLEVRWYSIAYLIGLVFSYFYISKYGKDLFPSEKIDSLFLVLISGVIIGGRLGYVLFYNPFYYLQNPVEILKLWQGGMSFHGGLIGVILGVIVFSRVHKVVAFRILDNLACSVPIGIFLGRVSNFINGELFGMVTDVSWGVVFPRGGPLPRHPSQIYEALGEGILLFAIMQFFFFRTKLATLPRCLSGVFLISYSSLRVILEFFRQPDSHVGFIIGNWVTMGHLLSVPMLVYGIILIVQSLNTSNGVT